MIQKTFFSIFTHGLQKTQKNSFAIFLCFGTNVGQSFEPIIMRFFAISSEFSRLPSYRLTFFDFCPGTSKNSHELATGCQKFTGCQKHATFQWTDWVKKKITREIFFMGSWGPKTHFEQINFFIFFLTHPTTNVWRTDRLSKKKNHSWNFFYEFLRS